MTPDPIAISHSLRTTDNRWVALTSAMIASGVLVLTSGAAWLRLTPATYFNVNWNIGAPVAGMCSLFILVAVASLCVAMIAGRPRSYLPSTLLLWILVAAAVGTFGMLLVAHQATYLSDTPGALKIDRYFLTDPVETPIVQVTNALWATLAALFAVTVSSAKLWNIARKQHRDSRIALAVVDAQLAMVAGDLVEEHVTVELVPTL